MKKILFLTDGHLPVPAVQGGAVPTLIESIVKTNETEKKFHINIVSLYNLEAKNVAFKYNETKFFYVKKNNLISLFDMVLNKFFKLFMNSNNKRELDFFWKKIMICYCRKILRKYKYNYIIIENHGYLTKIFNDKHLRLKYKNKIYYHLHNEIPNSVSRKVEPNLKYILISEYLKKGIITKFGTESSSRTAVIKNGIDTTSANLTLTSLEKKELRNNLGLKHSDYVVIFVGRIVKEKGIKEVLEAFEMINENNIKLLILGGTEFANNVQSRFEQEIKDKCRKLQDKVIFTGYIDHEDVWKYYQISDLALLPSMWEEPAGLTIIEAMCNGIPVITTNSGGIPEYMNDKYGVMLNRTPKIAEEIVFSINKFYNKEIKVDTNSERKYVLNNFTEENFYNSFVKLLK